MAPPGMARPGLASARSSTPGGRANELPAKTDEAQPAAPAAAAPAAAAPAADNWSKSRIKVAELIWGDGFNFPAALTTSSSWSSPSASTRKNRCSTSVRPGWRHAAIAKEFGTYVEGMEHSPALAKAGMELSEKAGLAKKASIVAFDPMKVYFTPPPLRRGVRAHGAVGTSPTRSGCWARSTRASSQGAAHLYRLCGQGRGGRHAGDPGVG